MLDAAREGGLDKRIAEGAVATVVCDGAAMLTDRIADAAAMVETYRDYRGTTAAGLAVAEA